MLARGNQMPVMHHIFGAIDVYGTPQRVRVHYTLTDVPTEVVVGDHTFYVALAPSLPMRRGSAMVRCAGCWGYSISGRMSSACAAQAAQHRVSIRVLRHRAADLV